MYLSTLEAYNVCGLTQTLYVFVTLHCSKLSSFNNIQKSSLNISRSTGSSYIILSFKHNVFNVDTEGKRFQNRLIRTNNVYKFPKQKIQITLFISQTLDPTQYSSQYVTPYIQGKASISSCFCKQTIIYFLKLCLSYASRFRNTSFIHKVLLFYIQLSHFWV